MFIVLPFVEMLSTYRHHILKIIFQIDCYPIKCFLTNPRCDISVSLSMTTLNTRHHDEQTLVHDRTNQQTSEPTNLQTDRLVTQAATQPSIQLVNVRKSTNEYIPELTGISHMDT